MKRNNPFNIRFNSCNDWLGQVRDENGFVFFQSPYYGFRAGLKLLLKYINDGHDSVERIIYRFAPPSENPTEHYIEFVIHKFKICGLAVTRHTRFSKDFESVKSLLQLSVLMFAMHWFENGDPDEYDVKFFLDFFYEPKIRNVLLEMKK